ncbi:MAG: hypothetical protein ACKOJ9_04940 [Actinomycetota bacterium]
MLRHRLLGFSIFCYSDGSTMEPIEFPQDFKEFLRLLHDHEIDYLLVGGFAVALHGYVRTTAD